jgi:hypothetical protein
MNNRDPRRQPFDLPNVVAALAILGIGTGSAVGAHSRLLQANRTLQANQYIISPTKFEIAAGVELELGSDAELMVV